METRTECTLGEINALCVVNAMLPGLESFSQGAEKIGGRGGAAAVVFPLQ